MRTAMVLVVCLTALVFGTSVDLGIGLGHAVEMGEAPQPVPMLSVGATLGELYTGSAHVLAVGFSDRWEYFATAAAGYGPVRLGVSVSEEGTLAPCLGFDAPFGDYFRVTSRVLGLTAQRDIYTAFGFTLGL